MSTLVRDLSGFSQWMQESYRMAPDIPVEQLFLRLTEEMDRIVDPERRTLLVEFVISFRKELFEAPASRRHHECWPGGLLQHILHFHLCGLSLIHHWGAQASFDSLLTVSVLHDFCKASDDQRQPRYLKVMDPGSSAPFEMNPRYFEGQRYDDGPGSLMVLEIYGPRLAYSLTEPEIHAIRFHDLGWNKAINSEKEIPPLTILAHAADMLSSRGHFPQ